MALIDAAVKAIKNPNLWIKLADHVYQILTRRSALNEDDLDRYNRMCDLYLIHFGESGATIPEQWVLDERIIRSLKQ